eukprot:10494013-Alexandrium_andersonii.AAC.1
MYSGLDCQSTDSTMRRVSPVSLPGQCVCTAPLQLLRFERGLLSRQLGQGATRGTEGYYRAGRRGR